jgi:hypothetical protein
MPNSSWMSIYQRTKSIFPSFGSDPLSFSAWWIYSLFR